MKPIGLWAVLCLLLGPGVRAVYSGDPQTGACCFPYGTFCIEGYDSDSCAAEQGDYLGDGSSCSVEDVCPPLCEGDANADGVVDPLDSGFVLSRLGCPVSSGDIHCQASDVNDDGVVDPLDLGFVQSRLGVCFFSEETKAPGCDGFDWVPMTVSPFVGESPPDPLPSGPIMVGHGDAWGVVVEVGDLGNNEMPLLLLTLDDNTINGDTGSLIGFKFVTDSDQTFVFSGMNLGESGLRFALASLFTEDASSAGCDNVSQVYNYAVPVTLEGD